MRQRPPAEPFRSVPELSTIGFSFPYADHLAENAALAANWLRQAASMRVVTPSILDAIRRYFRRVSIIPDAVFVPPVQIEL